MYTGKYRLTEIDKSQAKYKTQTEAVAYFFNFNPYLYKNNKIIINNNNSLYHNVRMLIFNSLQIMT
jgi:hypothetical protein